MLTIHNYNAGFRATIIEKGASLMEKQPVFTIDKSVIGIKDISWSMEYYLNKHKKSKTLEEFYLNQDDNILRGITEAGADNPVELYLSFDQQNQNSLIMKGTFFNRGRMPILLNRLRPLVIDEAKFIGEDPLFFRQGWQSSSSSAVFSQNQRETESSLKLNPGAVRGQKDSALATKGSFSSDMYAVLKTAKQGYYLLIGALRAENQFLAVKLLKNNMLFGGQLYLMLEYFFDGAALDGGQSIELEPVLITWGPDGQSLLDKYIDMIGKIMNSRISESPGAFWTSKGYYGQNISQKEILKNAIVLNSQQTEYPVELMQIDEGYQLEYGDWLTANKKFSLDLKALASKIKSYNLKPSLTVAPFIVGSKSAFYLDNPDIVLKDMKGQPLEIKPLNASETCYALDTTNPRVAEFLTETFTTLKKWGFQHFNLNYLFAAATTALRYDPYQTGCQSLRRGLEIIREAVGEEAFLRGSDCPFGPAVGFLDAVKISGDEIFTTSKNLNRLLPLNLMDSPFKKVMRNIITRSYLHQKWWLNDTQSLVFFENKKGCTIHQIRALATAIALCKSLINISVDFEKLSRESKYILENVFKISQEVQGGEVDVIDLLTVINPVIVFAKGEDNNYIAVFNLADKKMKREIDLDQIVNRGYWPNHLVDYWTREAFNVRNNQLDLYNIPPLGVKLFKVPKE